MMMMMVMMMMMKANLLHSFFHFFFVHLWTKFLSLLFKVNRIQSTNFDWQSSQLADVTTIFYKKTSREREERTKKDTTKSYLAVLMAYIKHSSNVLWFDNSLLFSNSYYSGKLLFSTAGGGEMCQQQKNKKEGCCATDLFWMDGWMDEKKHVKKKKKSCVIVDFRGRALFYTSTKREKRGNFSGRSAYRKKKISLRQIMWRNTSRPITLDR